MCEIHFIKPINRKIELKDIMELAKIMEISSSTNHDGFGVFNEKGEIYKSGEAFSMEKHVKELEKFVGSSWIVAHNRFATHGEPKKANSHPFKNEKFVWVHNGVVQNHRELQIKYHFRAEVDSQVVGFLAKDIGLKNALNELCGSFSIFIYDFQKSKLYYVKHNASFHFVLLNHDDDYVLIGDTSEQNLEYYYAEVENEVFGIFTRKYKIVGYFEPEENVVYKINSKIEIAFRIEPKEWICYDYGDVASVEIENLMFECGLDAIVKETKNYFKIYPISKGTSEYLSSVFGDLLENKDSYFLLDKYFADDFITCLVYKSEIGEY